MAKKSTPEPSEPEIIRTGESLFDLLDSNWEDYDGEFESVDYEAGANYE